MFLDFTYVVPSVLVGLTVGFMAGLWGSHYAIDAIAKRLAQTMFDSHLKLREQARAQMTAHDATTKGRSSYAIKRA